MRSPKAPMRSPKRPMRLAVLAVGLLAALTGCSTGRTAGTSPNAVKLTLVAYSTPKEAFAELIPAFQQTDAGKDVTFTQSYGASGDQSRAVAAGLPADVVEFSLAPDVTKLVKANLVSADWDADRHKGMVTDSVVVFAVRKGNPKHIRTWDDLVRPGVDVIEPNPFTSGGARWNVMAAYGAQVRQGRSPEQAKAYLGTLFRHVSVQDKSARESLQTFAGGKGDVLLAYENEAIAARQKHVELDYVVPDQTILISNPVAVTTRSKHPREARAFVDFLRSETAQDIFAAKGYRPVLAASLAKASFPKPKDLFTIDELGGWKDVATRFFDPDTGIVAGIERQVGGSTGTR